MHLENVFTYPNFNDIHVFSTLQPIYMPSSTVVFLIISFDLQKW